ncbi:MAG: metal-dependent hydrolase [Elusimicrobia bacterium CG08_land_8_20_14_0_20_44_26]|nr:MAG: metal-dependent hydrolase [Elusimicrobia bacterium CG08_land_8_20_14_0_20_44_26]
MRKSKTKTKAELKTLINKWAQEIKVIPKQIRVQEMRNKWASCSTSGWISFSSDLLDKSRKFQDYVIIHELLHLKIPNHGKLFKSMMNAFSPNWEKAEILFNKNPPSNK